MSLRPEPKRQKNGLCARPGCGRRLQRAKRGQEMLALALAEDPFCSARCCREFHGVVLSMPEQDERQNRPTPEGREWAGRSARHALQRKVAA